MLQCRLCVLKNSKSIQISLIHGIFTFLHKKCDGSLRSDDEIKSCKEAELRTRSGGLKIVWYISKDK